MNRFRVTVDGRTHDVVVEVLEDIKSPARPLVPTAAKPLETAAMSFGPPPHVLHAVTKDAGPAGALVGAVLSPLAGKVVTIDVQLGASVAEGVQVATIEAMKMNTYVFAPVAGKVTSIDARSGDAVEEGAILLRIT